MNITEKHIAVLRDLYKRVADSFAYDVGEDEQERIMADFENLLVSFGVKFVEPTYGVRPYYDRTENETRWGIYEKAGGDWVLTGFKTADEAVEIAKDKRIFHDYDGSEITVDTEAAA